MEVPLTPGEEKPESTDKKSVGRVRNAAEVLQQWLHFRTSGEKPEQSVEDQETEEDDDESSIKRWRGIFKKFFGSHVSKEAPIAQTAETSAPESNQATLPLFMTEALSTEDKPVEELPLPGLEVDSVIKPEAAKPTTPAETITPNVVESTTTTPVETPLDPLEAAHYEQSQISNVPETMPPLQPLVGPENQAMYSRSATETVPRQEGDIYDDTIALRDEANLRRANMINSYRNHRRKKDIKHASRQIHELQKDQKETAEALKKQIANTPAGARSVNAPAARPLVEAAPMASRKAPEVSKLTPEAAPVAIKQAEQVPIETKAPESLKEILQKRTTVEDQVSSPQVQRQAEKLASHSYETVNPTAVLEQVEQAAEADVAIEDLFERRHEVKDSDAAYKVDDPSSAPAGSFVPVGSPAINAVSTLLPAPDDTPTRRAVMSKPKNSEEAYKQAAMGGFWAAVVLLVFIGILLVIR